MASMSKATTKRKADAYDGVVAGGGGKKARAEDEPQPPLHLPAPVWGRVLDYMPYQEVRSALLICKAIANEAVKYVHTLNIMRDCELDIPAARRFANVEEVNVLCLIKVNEAAQNWRKRRIISSIASRATVPFIQTFPRLSSMFVGGLVGGNKELYWPHNCSGVKHILLFRSLLSSFIGAYKTRALSQEISLSGVFDPNSQYSITTACKEDREDGVPPNECRFCREACKHLPLKDCHLFETDNLCLNNETKEGILLGRTGGKGVILWTQYADLIDRIKDHKDWYYLNHDIKVDQELYEKLVEMGLEDGREGDPQYISSEALREIDGLVLSLKINLSDIPKDLFYERMSFGTKDAGREWDVWCKSTVDSLIARGYPIDPKDLIIVDEEQEPAIQRIIQSKRGSNSS